MLNVSIQYSISVYIYYVCVCVYYVHSISVCMNEAHCTQCYIMMVPCKKVSENQLTIQPRRTEKNVYRVKLLFSSLLKDLFETCLKHV